MILKIQLDHVWERVVLLKVTTMSTANVLVAAIMLNIKLVYVELDLCIVVPSGT